MAGLTTKQRAYLRSLAHPLKPIAQIGKEGVTKAALNAIEGALNNRELLKVKVLDTAPESARDIAGVLVENIEAAQLVQVIGRTVVLYRPNPEKPLIDLPG
ncbi:MAG: ribosome assembly RNA-binding protein YhbY [Syntrophobacteraceae bacterium]